MIQYLSAGTLPEATETNKNSLDLHGIDLMLGLNWSLNCPVINGCTLLGEGTQNHIALHCHLNSAGWSSKLQAPWRDNPVSCSNFEIPEPIPVPDMESAVKLVHFS